MMELLVALWHWLLANWHAVVFVTVLPFIAEFLSKSDWSTDARGYIVLASCAAVGLGTPFVMGIVFIPENVILVVSALYGGATAAYMVFKRWKLTCRWMEWLLKFNLKRFLDLGN